MVQKPKMLSACGFLFVSSRAKARHCASVHLHVIVYHLTSSIALAQDDLVKFLLFVKWPTSEFQIRTTLCTHNIVDCGHLLTSMTQRRLLWLLLACSLFLWFLLLAMMIILFGMMMLVKFQPQTPSQCGFHDMLGRVIHNGHNGNDAQQGCHHGGRRFDTRRPCLGESLGVLDGMLDSVHNSLNHHCGDDEAGRQMKGSPTKDCVPFLVIGRIVLFVANVRANGRNAQSPRTVINGIGQQGFHRHGTFAGKGQWPILADGAHGLLDGATLGKKNLFDGHQEFACGGCNAPKDARTFLRPIVRSLDVR